MNAVVLSTTFGDMCKPIINYKYIESTGITKVSTLTSQNSIIIEMNMQ